MKVQATFAPFVIVMSNFKDSLMGSREAPDFFRGLSPVSARDDNRDVC